MARRYRILGWRDEWCMHRQHHKSQNHRRVRPKKFTELIMPTNFKHSCPATHPANYCKIVAFGGVGWLLHDHIFWLIEVFFYTSRTYQIGRPVRPVKSMPSTSRLLPEAPCPLLYVAFLSFNGNQCLMAFCSREILTSTLKRLLAKRLICFFWESYHI